MWPPLLARAWPSARALLSPALFSARRLLAAACLLAGPAALIGAAGCRNAATAQHAGAQPADAAPGSAASPRAEQPAVRFDTPRGTWIVRVELARTPEQRQRGLMYRRDLPRDGGMLFVFDDSDDHTFWMRNTFVSLDMIFLGDDRAVVGVVSSARPQSDEVRGIGKPSRYVLEVAAGEADAHAVGPGARAIFVNVPE